jgi:L-seryl-tRNA(Ser) seleniumtransferase
MTTSSLSSRLRALPSVDALLRSKTAVALRDGVGAERLTVLARRVTEEMRSELQANGGVEIGNGGDSREGLLSAAERRLEAACRRATGRGLRRVVNATGVILHTNLGRAPLSEGARGALAHEAAGYCTLEWDLESGKRGGRGARVEQLLTELTGAEAALVVNNCAAAALLTLTVLARDGESIISRGELVEIGGDFRVPDVMAQSGTRMIEVGTTNRTRLSDYQRMLTDQTRLIVRVHASNYRIVGFSSVPTLAELAELAHKAAIPLYEDAGSGALVDLRQYGVSGEPVISESIASGADVVSFSGDKLLGGPQAGLIVGRRELVRRLRSNPLYRALRADKLILGALEATLETHRRGAALSEIPALSMLSSTYAEVESRARAFVSRLSLDSNPGALKVEIVPGHSAVGGGAAPTTSPRTALIALEHETLSAGDLERALRGMNPPVIARIGEGRVLLDLRTVCKAEETELFQALRGLPR